MGRTPAKQIRYRDKGIVSNENLQYRTGRRYIDDVSSCGSQEGKIGRDSGSETRKMLDISRGGSCEVCEIPLSYNIESAAKWL